MVWFLTMNPDYIQAPDGFGGVRRIYDPLAMAQKQVKLHALTRMMVSVIIERFAQVSNNKLTSAQVIELLVTEAFDALQPIPEAATPFEELAAPAGPRLVKELDPVLMGKFLFVNNWFGRPRYEDHRTKKVLSPKKTRELYEFIQGIIWDSVGLEKGKPNPTLEE